LTFLAKLKTVAKLKQALQTIWAPCHRQDC